MLVGNYKCVSDGRDYEVSIEKKQYFMKCINCATNTGRVPTTEQHIKQLIELKKLVKSE